jgi:hypothetical protein
MPLTGIDETRLPQGWTQLPDGSYGPSSNLPDWLKQLIPSPGASTPYGPGGAPSYGAGPGGAYVPGGGVTGYQGTTPGQPSMGFPALGGPQMYGPQGSNVGTGKQVGPWTNPFTDAKTIDPREFAGAGSGAPSILSALAGGNPYARAMIAAGGVMTPSPAETGALPLSMSGARPMHPASTGAMPGPQPGADGINPYAAAAAANPPQGGPYVGSGAPGALAAQPGMPHRPYSPTPQNYPSWPTPPAPEGNVAPFGSMTADHTPQGTPSDTPRPAPYPPRRPKNLGPTAAAPASNPRFGTVQYQIPGSGQGGPLSRSPIYTTLNLFGGRS